MGGGLPKLAESSEAVGHVIKGSGKVGNNDAVPVSGVQGGGTFGALIQKLEMGGDRLDAQGPGWVPLSVGLTDHGDNSETQGRRRVGVPLGSGGNKICRDPPNQGVHQEVED